MEQPYQHYETKDLINDLKQGKELAKQLQIHLNAPSSTHEIRELLAHKIVVSFDKVLAILISGTSIITTGDQHIPGGGQVIATESPRSFSGSPGSKDSDKDFKGSDSNLGASRKRKAMPRWTKQVKVQPGTGIEGSLADRYSWRKYGQKDILGARYPRGYYRCTHRHVQGCLATKQVQKSDNDSTMFEIRYRGRHTCSDQFSTFAPPPSEKSEPSKSQLFTNIHDHQQNSQEVILNFKTDLKVITEDLDTCEQINIPTSFDFPSTSNNNINNNSANYSPSHHYMLDDINFGADIGSIYNLSEFGGNFQNLPAIDTELNEIISAATSATNSPTVGVNYQYGEVAFNSNFTFDNPGFFP